MRYFITNRSRRNFLTRLGFALHGLVAGNILSSFRLSANTLNQETLADFRMSISGQIFAPGDKDYEFKRLRSIWQLIKPGRYPSFIVQASSVDDVIETVKFASINGFKISVRCGGHSYYASFLQSDMIMLDLSELKEITVDEKNYRATVQPAMRSQDFMAEIEKFGFSFPAAHCGNVPLGGFLLGGGLGWNGEAWGGMSCFNIREVEVVTAEGELIVANENTNEDYYWAARGAGPNFFGVVTKFTLDLYDNPDEILTTTLIWELERAPEVSKWLEAKTRSMPDYVESLFIIGENPDPDQRKEVSKVCIAQVSVFADDLESAKSALGQLTGPDLPQDHLVKDELISTPIAALYSWDAGAYPPLRWDVDALWTDDPSASLVTKLISHMEEMPSEFSSILLQFKPHTNSMPDAAFTMIGGTYLACYAIWPSSDEDSANNSWVKNTMRILEPHTKGHYINESNYADNPLRCKNSFTTDSWDKLKTLSVKYDPDKLFHSYLN